MYKYLCRKKLMLIMSSNTILNNTRSAFHFLAMSVLTRQVISLVQLLFCMALNVSITSIKKVLTFYNPTW